MSLPTPSAEEIRAHRARLSVTQAQYGELLGYSARAVQQWEGGQKQMHPATWMAYRALGIGRVRRLLRAYELWDTDIPLRQSAAQGTSRR
jgi:DNA-binding XRE family transcriptional regulator